MHWLQSSAQIALKWAVQRGTVALPKSINPTRLAENIAIFDFELSADDVAAIDKLDADYHYLRPNDWYQVLQALFLPLVLTNYSRFLTWIDPPFRPLLSRTLSLAWTAYCRLFC